MKLWDDFDEGPYVINPGRLLIMNGSGKMKRNSKGQFVKNAGRKRRRHSTRRRHAASSNLPAHHRRSGRRRARRNPVYEQGGVRILGVPFPTLNNLAWSGAGFIAPPIVEGFAMRFLPAVIAGNKIGRYAIKIGTVVGLALGVKTLIGADEAKRVAQGGAIYILANAWADIAPMLTGGSAGASYYSPGEQVGSYFEGAGAQPLLAGMGSMMTDNIPSRLDPAERF
jgi:hypothetical protein